MKKKKKDIEILDKPLKGLKKFAQDFKAFIQRGNVLNLAVGVIIGAAFTAIVNSFTKDIFMPLITALFGVFGVAGGLKGMSLVLNGVPQFLEDGTTINPDAILWNYGTFIQAIIDFLLTALVVFCIIKLLTAAGEAAKKAKERIEDRIDDLIDDEEEEKQEAVVEEAPAPAPAPEPTPDPNAEITALRKEIKERREKQNAPKAKAKKSTEEK